MTNPLAEPLRLRRRNLLLHIDNTKRKLVCSEFENEVRMGQSLALPQLGSVDHARFKRMVQDFFREHDDNLAQQKLRRDKPLAGGRWPPASTGS